MIIQIYKNRANKPNKDLHRCSTGEQVAGFMKIDGEEYSVIIDFGISKVDYDRFLNIEDYKIEIENIDIEDGDYLPINAIELAENIIYSNELPNLDEKLCEIAQQDYEAHKYDI